MLHFQLEDPSPPRGAVGSVTFLFHVFVAFPTPPPALLAVREGGFGLVSLVMSPMIVFSSIAINYYWRFSGCRACPFRGVELDFEWVLRSRIFDYCSYS